MNLQKANIDYRKVVAFVVMLVLLFVSYQAYQYKKSSSLQSLTIEIVKENDQRPLLDKKEVMNMIRNELGFDPTASRIEDIDFPLTRQVRYLDKLVDELAKGRKMEKILREAN